MNIIQPLGLIALLSVPAIIALYMLRSRRAPQRVGSLLLWRRAQVRALEGRPWERFRPNILLALQILAALALVCALIRPACVEDVVRKGRVVVVLDASASMGSRSGQNTRWVEALREAKKVVEANASAEISILRAGRTTRVVQDWTTQTSTLIARLAALEDEGVDATPSSVSDALLLGLQLHAHREDGARMILISDGAFDHSQLPTQALQLQYVHVGGETCSNAGIGLFALRRAPEQRFHAHAVCTVVNPGCERVEGSLEISLDGVSLETHRVALDPGEEATFSVPISSDQGTLSAHLRPPSNLQGGVWNDNLTTDNEAFAVLVPQKPLRVLSVGQNDLVHRALRMHRRFQVSAMDPSGYTGPEDYDVVVFTDFFPASIPNARMLVLSPPRTNPWYDDSGQDLTAPRIASWDHGHPALFHVELSAVHVAKAPRIQPAPHMTALGEFSGEDGAFLIAGQTPQWRALVWTPDLFETDFPLHVSFPIFLYNAMGWLSPGGSLVDGHSVSAGDPLVVSAPATASLRIERPDQRAHRTQADFTESDGVRLFAHTDRVGVYTVHQTNPERSHVFAVSMNNPVESNITPQPKLTLARGGFVPTSQPAQEQREWWPYALVFFLLVVCAEWVVHTMRRQRFALHRRAS